MSLLSAIARITVDKTGFDAGLAAAGRGMEKFGAGLKSQLAGAFSAAAAVSIAKHIFVSSVQAGEAIGDLADRLSVSVEAAHSFGLAARLSGVDVDYFAQKLEKLRAFVAKGGDLGAFGIETKDSIEALSQLAQIIDTTGLNAAQSAKFVEIFGKGSGKFINVLGDLGKARAAWKFTDQEVRSSQKLSDLWVIMGNALDVMVGKYLAYHNIFSKGTGVNVNKADLAAIQAEENRQDEIDKNAKGHMATQERIVDMEKEANELNEKARKSKLTDAQRLLEIKKQEAILQANLADESADENGTFGEGYYMMRNRLAELGAERGGIEEKMRKSFHINSDEFQRTGAFTGASAQAAQMDLARRTLTELERMRINMESKGILVRGTD